MKFSNRYFLIIAGLFLVAGSILFSVQTSFAIPAYCNYDGDLKCCGRILNCSFPNGAENMWCGGAQVGWGDPCL